MTIWQKAAKKIRKQDDASQAADSIVEQRSNRTLAPHHIPPTYIPIAINKWRTQYQMLAMKRPNEWGRSETRT